MERSTKLVVEKFGRNLLSTLGMVASIAVAAIVDRIMVGNLLGPTELAALNLNSPIICIMNVIFGLFLFGGNTLALTLKAGRDHTGANKAFTISIGLGTAIEVIAALAGIVFCSPLANLLCGGNTELYRPVVDYLVPLLILGMLIIPVNGTCAFTRADDMQRLAFAVPVVSNVVNLLFDYIFMGLLNMGITSAGYATVIGYIVGVFCLIPYFRSEKRSFFFTPLRLEDFKLISETMKTGLASTLVDVGLLIQSFVMNIAVISYFGTSGAQVVAVCVSANSIAAIFYRGTTQTMLPIGGALYGEKDYTGLKSIMRSGFFLTEAFMLLLTILFGIFARPFGLVFGVTSPEALKLMDSAFRLFLPILPVVGAQECLRVILQSTNRKITASVLSGASGTVCFLPVIWLLSKTAPMLLWLSFALSSLLAICGCFVYLLIQRNRSQNAGGLLLPENGEGAKFFEFSIHNTLSEAEKASVKMISLCKDNGVDDRFANYLGIAVEELCTNIAKYAYKNQRDFADIFFRIEGEELLLRIRDNGVIFNPAEFVDDSGAKVTGLKLMKQLPVKVEYNWVLGFNNTIVIVNPQQA